MGTRQPRPHREQFSARVRLLVEGHDHVIEHYAENLSEGGLFVRTREPPPRGSTILLEFVLPDGTPLSRCAAKVAHSKAGAGMGLEFIQLDDTAKGWAQRFNEHVARSLRQPPEAERGRAGRGAAEPTKLHGPLGPPRLLTLSGPVVGIDLGTINSCVAVVRDGEAQLVTAPGGYDTIPSIVHIDEDGDVMVGHPARERMILSPERAIYASKRFLGRPFASREVKALAHFYRYELIEGDEGRVAARVGDRVMPLEEVAARVLSLLKQIATVALGVPVQRAVITVPAYFGETQRQAVRDAGRLAGLYVERILNEPTAAAVAYGFGRGLDETILVYDFGGGTFDASVLRIQGDRMEVLASDGDPFLGGLDLDDRLTEYILGVFERQTGIDLRPETIPVQRVRFAAEMAKKQLSQATVATIHLPFIHPGTDGSKPLDLELELTREILERLTGDLIERTLDIVQQVLDRAEISSAQLDDVVLVGGQSRSPAVHRLLAERFGKRPCRHVHPDEAIALGAARVAHGLGDQQEAAEVSGAPCVSGAPGWVNNLLAASIRVGLRDGMTQTVLPRGRRLPVETQLEIPLPADAGTQRRVSLYRGEAPAAADNTLLGNLSLPGLAAGGDPATATLTLSVSADGLLSVRGHHPTAGNVGELDVLLL